ncbi:AAA family ATPase [Streptomyces sp. NPDC051976]|uniref:AAA family ATPase n=1 Tax=Streptomyces sp. NPDC051976 TaxID=3154947 RepID=UPI003426AA6C
MHAVLWAGPTMTVLIFVTVVLLAVGSILGRRLARIAEAERAVARQIIDDRRALGIRSRRLEAEDYLGLTLEPRYEAAYRPGADRPPRMTVDPVDILLPARGGVLVVLGAPGSGKSSLLRHVARTLGRRALGTTRRPIPLLLDLPAHAQEIVHGARTRFTDVATHTPWTRAFRASLRVSRLLVRTPCVVLVDGIDDIPDENDRARVVGWLRREIAAHPRYTWVIVSRRIRDPTGGLPDAAVVRISPLTAAQIDTYVQREIVSHASPEGAATTVDEWLASVAAPALDRMMRQEPLRDLTSNPLMLSVVVDAFTRRRSVLPSMSEVYREILDELLERRQRAAWSSERGALHPSESRRRAQLIALAMMEQRHTVARGIEIPVRWDIVDSMIASGVLVEPEPGLVAFAHRSMQEYLAAEQIRLESGSVRTLTERIEDPFWRQTILFWAAQSDASPVVEACLDLGTERALELAERCVEVSRVDVGLRQALLRELEHSAGRAGVRTFLGGTSPLSAYIEDRYAEPARARLRRVDDGVPLIPSDIDEVLREAGAFTDPSGGRWPQEEAEAYLSAAVLATALGRDQEASRHRFRGLIALALRMNRQNQDSARDLCLAALACLDRQERHLAEAALAVSVHLRMPRPGPSEHRSYAARVTREALLVHADRHRHDPAAFEALVPLLATSEDAAGLIQQCLRDDPYLGDIERAFLRMDGSGAQTTADAWTARVEDWRRTRRDIAQRLAGLARLDLEQEALRQADERLAGSWEMAPFPLAADVEVLRRAVAALRSSLDLWRFEPKDAALRTAERFAEDLRAAVAGAPTALGVELVEPAAVRIGELARTARQRLAKAQAPLPEVAPALPSARLRGSTVTVQLRVSNAEGRAPVESGWLDVGADPARLEPASQRVDLPVAVRGGSDTTVLVRFSLADDGGDRSDVGLTVTLHHQPRGRPTAAEPWALTLPVDRDFTPVDPNPFSDGATGRPVDDPSMFYGRDELVERIRARLRDAPSPGVGVAVVGQKRAGKSSIRLQLARRLSEEEGLPVVDVHNLAELEPPRTGDADRQLLGALLWRILEGAQRTLAPGSPPLLPPGLDRQALIASPDPVFDFGDLFGRHREAAPQRPPWVVFIDEFQHLEEWVRDGLLSPSFMRAFKAIVERRLFHLVLVGHSDVERLIAADPNAFGVFGIERVTYLDGKGARALIEEPVPLPEPVAGGVSRYAGHAVDDIVRLSGGNPFYIQRLCSGLVAHMNTEHAARVTEADVRVVADRLVGTLKEADFDNLESPGTMDAAWTADDVRAVLAAVAHACDGSPAPATRSDIDRHYTGYLPQALLDDLTAREIITRQGNGFRIVVGLYEAWLRRYYGPSERTE